MISSFLLPDGLTKAFVVLTFMVLFVFCKQLALNIPVWVIIAEVFPLDIRGLGMGVSVLCLWATNAIIAFLFPILVQTIRIQGAFLVFVVLGLIAIPSSRSSFRRPRIVHWRSWRRRSRPATSTD